MILRSAALILLAATLVVAACGKRGDPIPPSQSQAADDAEAE